MTKWLSIRSIDLTRSPRAVVPGKPGAPEATDWSTSHVELAWEAPASDGSSPITGYIIEIRVSTCAVYEPLAPLK